MLGIITLFTQCQKEEIPLSEKSSETIILPQEFKIALNQTFVIRSNNQQEEIGRIQFVQLEESQCPANAMCIRQGSAVTHLKIISTKATDAKTVRYLLVTL